MTYETTVTVAMFVSWYVCGIASMTFLTILGYRYNNLAKVIVIGWDDVFVIMAFGLWGPITGPMFIAVILFVVLCAIIAELISKIKFVKKINDLRIKVIFK
jgi:uncharacterized membrane protein